MNILKTRLVMRKGNEYIVSREQGDSIRQRIAQSNGSTFINIPHLGTTVNSADISEIRDEVEQVAQRENLLDTAEWTGGDLQRRIDIVRKMRAQLEERGVLKRK